MIDFQIRCSSCDRVPATLRLNGTTVCRECALRYIDLASPPPPPTAPTLTDQEIAVRIEALVRSADAAGDRPPTTDMLRKAVRYSYERVDRIARELANEGRLAPAYVGRKQVGWQTPGRTAPIPPLAHAPVALALA